MPLLELGATNVTAPDTRTVETRPAFRFGDTPKAHTYGARSVHYQIGTPVLEARLIRHVPSGCGGEGADRSGYEGASMLQRG